MEPDDVTARGSYFVDRARQLADELLFPAAVEVDLTSAVPDGHFELLADEGYYGIVAPCEFGGAGLGLPELVAVIEVLAGGCLATTLTWLQHHGVVLALTDTHNTPLWAEYLTGLALGTIRAGVAVAGAASRPATLTAVAVADGFRLSGTVPMVSGWNGIDLVLVSAAMHDRVVSGLVDTCRAADAGIVADRVPLVAAHGAHIVRLRFDDHLLPTERVTRQVTRREFTAGRWLVSRLYGALALGVASRCTRMLAECRQPGSAANFHHQLTRARDRLDTALVAPHRMPAAHAGAVALAYRAAGALVTASGSGSLLLSHHAQRLAREAALLLVTSTTHEVRTELCGLLTR